MKESELFQKVYSERVTPSSLQLLCSPSPLILLYPLPPALVGHQPRSSGPICLSGPRPSTVGADGTETVSLCSRGSRSSRGMVMGPESYSRGPWGCGGGGDWSGLPGASPQQNSLTPYFPEPVTMSLFGKSVFADVTKSRVLR